MNQILSTKIIKKIHKHKQFIVLFFISIIAFLCFFMFYVFFKIQLNKEHNNSVKLSNNFEIIKLCTIQSTNNPQKDSDILGSISIPVLNVNYAFFNGYSEELLKTLPCRFYGEMPPKKGNLCITAHNYNDDRFFGRINLLKNNDKIIIEDNFSNKFIYYVSDIYEVDENDLSPIEVFDKNKYTLTLITCNNINKKRIIVRAY